MEKDLYRGRREDPKAGPRAPDKTGKPITPGKMMASAADLLNKSFKEAKEKQEYDYEGDMAMSQLKSIIANAQRIHDMLERDTNIPEWVQSKITLAEDYVSTAANYMQGEMKEDMQIKEGMKEKIKGAIRREKSKELPLVQNRRDYAHYKAGEAYAKGDQKKGKRYMDWREKSLKKSGLPSSKVNEEGEGGPVNVAANVTDPQNKKLFTKPAKRKMPSFKSFAKK